jgi:type IV secretion system protein VirB10
MWWSRVSSTTSSAPDPGRVADYRTTPAGVVQRHLQQWLLIGVALVMVAIMALSGTPTKPRSTSQAAAVPVVDPNQQRIEEYQRRVQEQAGRLAAEQAQLELAKNAVSSGAASSTPSASGDAAPPARLTTSAARTDSVTRVSDNVAFSKDRSATGANPPSAEPMVTPPPVVFPSGAVMNVPAAPIATPPMAVPAASPTPAGQVAGGRSELSPSAPNGSEPRYRLMEGTMIDTVLTNRLDGTFNGPVNCLVSVPVYASDYLHVVIPAGARVLGNASAVATFGQSRLAVAFQRILLPNGTHIDLNGFHGLNQVGDLGLRDQVDRHYAQLFGVSLAIGAIAGLSQAQTNVGLDATGLDLYRQGVAANVSQSSARILDRFLNLLPTVTVREGHRIKVYLANDLDLPAYHESPAPIGGHR